MFTRKELRRTKLAVKSHKQIDDRFPWEIRWRSTTLPSSSSTTDQVAWLRVIYQNLLEQCRQLARGFRALGESMASYLENLLLQTLLKILIEPLQTTNAQIDGIEFSSDSFHPVAGSMQYADPFLSLARVIEHICRGYHPVKAAMGTSLKPVFKVLSSQCLLVAEYRSFEVSSPALPAVHIEVASNDVAKGDKILSDGNIDVYTAGIRAGFLFRGNNDTTVEDENLLNDILKENKLLDQHSRSVLNLSVRETCYERRLPSMSMKWKALLKALSS